jgi:hypothetical protein
MVGGSDAGLPSLIQCKNTNESIYLASKKGFGGRCDCRQDWMA